MTGDFTPDLRALQSADIIISTPEKWDGISRNWHTRSYVTKVISSCRHPLSLRCMCIYDVHVYYTEYETIMITYYANYIRVILQVGLMILDEIHLLGADRGPILEVLLINCCLNQILLTW